MTLASLLQTRSSIDSEIAGIIDRPMTAGHLGEYLAAAIFGIDLELSASATAIDGRFRVGPLQGKTVNIKWYLKHDGMLDMTTSSLLDHYLVLSGPASSAMSSRNATRPWVITHVYLLDAKELAADLLGRGRKVGVASSIKADVWAAAEVYPREHPLLPLTLEQSQALALFAPPPEPR